MSEPINPEVSDNDVESEDEDTHMEKYPAEHFDHFKWMCDGANTPAEIATCLRSMADEWDKLANLDATLIEAVDGGHVRYTIPGHTVEIECLDDGSPLYEDDDFMCPQCHKQD